MPARTAIPTSCVSLLIANAQRIARAASALEQERTGRVPKSVLVVLSDDLLVITLKGALSPAEKELCKTPAGAARVGLI